MTFKLNQHRSLLPHNLPEFSVQINNVPIYFSPFSVSFSPSIICMCMYTCCIDRCLISRQKPRELFLTDNLMYIIVNWVLEDAVGIKYWPRRYHWVGAVGSAITPRARGDKKRKRDGIGITRGEPHGADTRASEKGVSRGWWWWLWERAVVLVMNAMHQRTANSGCYRNKMPIQDNELVLPEWGCKRIGNETGNRRQNKKEKFPCP